MRELHVVNAAELARAYAAADYAVRLDGDILGLRVGVRASDLEAYCPAGCYVFITAWNPASQPTCDRRNQAADASLVTQLHATGAQHHPAWAQDPGGQWREPGWLLADLDASTTELLARQFGQAAVLAWRRGEPVRLRMLLPRPCPVEPSIDADTAAFTDWVE